MLAARTRPHAMNARIAITLTSANQYSTSPKRLTRDELIAMSAPDTATTHVHCGRFGNQNVK